MANLYVPKKYAAGEAPVPTKGGIIVIFAVEGAGKTTTLLNSEDVATPLFYNNFDRDAAHLLVTRKDEYYYEQYKASTRAEAEQQLGKFDGMVNLAVQTGHGVFGIDNGLSFWRTVKLAKLPVGDDPPPKAYDEANAYVEERLLRLEQSGLWVVITAPATEIWTGQKNNSGELEAKGWNNMKFHLVDEIMLFLNTKPRGTVPVPLAQTFEYTYNAYIKTAKKRPLVEGSVIPNPTLRGLMEKTNLIKREEK